MSSIPALVAVRNTVGKIIRLGAHEEVGNYLVTEDRIALKVNRVRCVERRWDTLITHRGFTVYTWLLRDGKWTEVPPFTQWWSTDERVTPFVDLSPAERRERETWESDCHRPGTARSPLDSAARQAQGY